MKVELKQRYVILVKYLSKLLGPNYEIALHDLSLKDHSLIALANGYITNRKIGDSYTPQIQKFIDEKRYLKEDFQVNYLEKISENRTLRTSTLYIMDDYDLVGLLCITFNDENHRRLANDIMRLCHPDFMLSADFQAAAEIYQEERTADIQKIENSIEKSIHFIRKKYKIGEKKLTKKDKLKIVGELKELHFFDIKGSIQEACNLLDISLSTIYRYLKQL